jgi:hypothetical protein
MSGGTLSILRIVIPGTVVFIFIAALVSPDLNEQRLTLFRDWYTLALTVIIPVFGVIYGLLPFRGWIWQPPRDSLDNNLKTKLLEPLKEKFTDEEKKRLQEGKVLLHMFFNIVDSDESLKEKAGGIRLNGLICTSIADIIAIGIPGCACFIVGYIFLHRTHYIGFSIGILIFVVVGFLFALPRFTKFHKKLSDEQIDALVVNHKPKLYEKFKEYLGKKDD